MHLISVVKKAGSYCQSFSLWRLPSPAHSVLKLGILFTGIIQ